MKQLHFGVDYYPEHWPEERWETDCELMQEMGVQFVRMAEFSWTKMESAEGVYHFEWLEKIIRMLSEHGIQTVLGTPTAAPPAWMVEEDRDILPITSNGTHVEFGGRHHDCQSNEHYRSHIRRFVTAMTETFGQNPNVVGWQIDNELGNSHYDLCYCESCANAFRKWLKKKYGTIECLNQSTGGAFWSQEYSSFEQVQPPRFTAAGHNPSILLDWKRFHSDLIVDFHHMQAEIIRKNSPGRFITHNCMGFCDLVSYFDLAESLDFISHDQYPGGYFAKQPVQDTEDLAATLDLMRCFKKKPFWIMEQQSYITGWETMGRLPKPGQIAMWSVQSIAHGADGICWFRWRSCSFGTEQYWHGILPSSGKPGRIYNELKNLITNISPIMNQLEGSMPKAKVAIVYSYDQEYAFSIQPHHKEFSYYHYLMTFYRALFKHHIAVDFVSDHDDLKDYSLVIAPLQYLMTEELEKHYEQYVSEGGHLVLTMRTGVKDRNNITMTERELPGKLSDVVGATVPEYDCLTDTDGSVRYQGKEYKIHKWADLLDLDTAQALAEYSFEFYAGTAAVTENSYGKGAAYYIGTEMSDELAFDLMGDICDRAGIHGIENIPDNVEVVSREKDGRTFTFIINHTGSLVTVDTEETGMIQVEPYGFVFK